MTLTTEQLDQALARPFVFNDRPTPAPSDLRPVWRVPVVLLLVRACRAQQATHEQLHVLNWAVRSAPRVEALAAVIGGQLAPDQAVVRFEPALDRAVALAHGFELLRWRTRFWTLTPRAHEALHEIDEETDLLSAEKQALASLPKPLTQTAVETVLRRRRP
jgi:hypothetical protein